MIVEADTVLPDQSQRVLGRVNHVKSESVHEVNEPSDSSFATGLSVDARPPRRQKNAFNEFPRWSIVVHIDVMENKNWSVVTDSFAIRYENLSISQGVAVLEIRHYRDAIEPKLPNFLQAEFAGVIPTGQVDWVLE